ncbi:MAG: hypothetical protein Fur005_33950 [Roseiflexaceae bacterium]
MWFTRFFIPALDPTLTATTDVGLRWLQFREQILTVLLRMIAVFSIPALLLSVGTIYSYGLIYLITLYFSFVVVAWFVAIRRTIDYRTRVMVLLVSAYLFAIGKLFGFGYSEDAYGFLVGLSLLSLLFLGGRAGVIALILSVSTLFGFGWSLSMQQFTPVISVVYVLMPEMVIATCLLFLAIVGGLQVSITVLFRGIEVAWLEAQQAREELERRVALRTQELAIAHQEALSLSQYRTEQNQFLAALNQTAIDLLRSQDRDTLLQSIVVRAAELLDAPYGQLLLLDQQRLIVHATTTNLHFLIGSEALRSEALTSWQAVDSTAPVILSDYQVWPHRRQVYDAIPLHAIANFPILIEQRCLGVLALGRTAAGYTFDTDTIQKAHFGRPMQPQPNRLVTPSIPIPSRRGSSSRSWWRWCYRTANSIPLLFTRFAFAVRPKSSCAARMPSSMPLPIPLPMISKTRSRHCSGTRSCCNSPTPSSRRMRSMRSLRRSSVLG